MNAYEREAYLDLRLWHDNMTKKPSYTEKIAKAVQKKTNSLIPDKAHIIITEAIKNMVKAVMVGSEFTTGEPILQGDLEYREGLAKEKLNFYRKAASLSGAGTGAGGFFIGLADFPILLGIKFKFLFALGAIYGYDLKDYKERLFLLYIFQLAFSSQEKVNEIYSYIANWEKYKDSLPEDINNFDWRSFQQEYRDYIDIAKMFQLVPGIGAVVGAYANYKLINKLAKTAMNAYRLRYFAKYSYK